jgi:hypothetical protein
MTIPPWPMSRSWVTSGPDLRSVLAPGPPLVRPARHHGGPGADRPRGRLPQPPVQGRTGQRWRPPPAHPALSAADQWKGRAVQPDPVGGMGVSAAVPLQRRPRPSLAAMGSPVQHAPRPHRPWRPPTGQPRYQPPWLLHLGTPTQDTPRTAGRRLPAGRRPVAWCAGPRPRRARAAGAAAGAGAARGAGAGGWCCVVVQRHPGEAPGSHEDASLSLYARR